MRCPFLILFLFGALACFSGVTFALPFGELNPAISNAVVALKNLPPMEGRYFCCDSITRAANNLERLGKEDALKALRLYLGNHNSKPLSNESENVLLICRLLFKNPEGWKQPGLGEPFPEVNRQVSDKNELFPLVLSRGAPFLLIYGFNGSGYTSDTADKCLQLCEGFTLIPRELPEGGYEDAANALLESKEFRMLYTNTNQLPIMEKMILAQAHCPNMLAPKNENVKSSIEVKMWSIPRTNN